LLTLDYELAWTKLKLLTKNNVQPQH